MGCSTGLTPSQKVFALDAATGKLLWKFDSGIKGTQPDRGLADWSDGKDRLNCSWRHELRIRTGCRDRAYLSQVSAKMAALTCAKNLGRDPASAVHLHDQSCSD